MNARQVIEAESPKHFLRNVAGRPYMVVFMKDTCRPWQYAQYDVDAIDQASAFVAGRAKLVAEVGPRRARLWKDHAAEIAHRRQEAETPKHFLQRVAPRLRYFAVMRPQAWVNDYAVPVDPQGPITWEVTDYLHSMEIQHGAAWYAVFLKKVLEGGDYESDSMQEAPTAPQWVKDWDGPFEIDVYNSEDFTRLYPASEVAEAEDPKEVFKRLPATKCRKCGSPLTGKWCADETCPYSDYIQAVELHHLHNMPVAEFWGKYGRDVRRDRSVKEAESPKNFLQRHAPPKCDFIIKKIGRRNVAVPVSPEAKRWCEETLPERREHGGFWPAMPMAIVIYDRWDTLQRMMEEGWTLKVEGPDVFTCRRCHQETPINGEGDPALFVGDLVQCPNCGRSSKLTFPPPQ